MTLTLYAIVNPSGEFARKQHHLAVYTTQRIAERYAKGKGQTVIPLTFDDGRGDKPVFIRGQVIDGGT